MKRQRVRRKYPAKPLKRGLGRAKRRKTKIDLWREWLVPDGAARRYQGLRGIYWYWLSRDVRKSEWKKWDGKCLTCYGYIHNWQEGDCGHVVPSRVCGEILRFARRNLTIQHKGCNNPRFAPHAPALNAIHYDERYGQGAFQKLFDERKTLTKVPTQEEYRQLIRSLPSYQSKLSSLK